MANRKFCRLELFYGVSEMYETKERTTCCITQFTHIQNAKRKNQIHLNKTNIYVSELKMNSCASKHLYHHRTNNNSWKSLEQQKSKNLCMLFHGFCLPNAYCICMFHFHFFSFSSLLSSINFSFVTSENM